MLARLALQSGILVSGGTNKKRGRMLVRKIQTQKDTITQKKNPIICPHSGVTTEKGVNLQMAGGWTAGR